MLAKKVHTELSVKPNERRNIYIQNIVATFIRLL